MILAFTDKTAITLISYDIIQHYFQGVVASMLWPSKSFSLAGAQVQLLLLFLPLPNISFIDPIMPLCGKI
jgi:hypothetical protein